MRLGLAPIYALQQYQGHDQLFLDLLIETFIQVHYPNAMHYLFYILIEISLEFHKTLEFDQGIELRSLVS